MTLTDTLRCHNLAIFPTLAAGSRNIRNLGILLLETAAFGPNVAWRVDSHQYTTVRLGRLRAALIDDVIEIGEVTWGRDLYKM